MPVRASAGFFSDLVGTIVGSKTQAADMGTDSTSVTHNSQNIPLLEASLTPDMKNTTVDDVDSIVDDQVLSANINPMDPASNLSRYATNAKIATYIVKKGDSIEGIAKKLKVSKESVAFAADLDKGEALKVGQVLAIIPVSVPAVKDTKVVAEKPTPKKDTVDTPVEKPKKVVAAAPLIDNTPKVVENPTPVVAPTPTPQPAVEAPAADQPVNYDSLNTGKPTGTIKGGYIWPFPEGEGRVSQGLHADQAFDFAAPKGTPIYAVQSGVVLIAHPTGYNGGYGKYIVINFDDGRQAIFGHMSKVLVEAGDVVKQGDIVGEVGTTGHSTGNHLHLGFHGPLGNPYIGLKVNSTGLVEND